MTIAGAENNVSDIAQFASSLTRISRPIIETWFRHLPYVERKEDSSPVTIADKNVEASLRKAIAETFPSHAIIGEEEGSAVGSSAYTWVIDPIDGTRAFSCGNPLFGTLIAVLHEAKPVIGVIDLPMLGTTWLGVRGEATLLNGKPVRAAQTHNLADARIATTSASALAEDYPRFEKLNMAARVTSYGGDCANYAHLAAGWCDLVAETHLKTYDIMATIPVIEGAGGVVSQWNGKPITLDDYDGTALASASRSLHDEAMAVLA
jgi:inositol-phosphate phosphatase/L-galactose 1-phosphate phosphatase/histidinol-phosphatase